MRLALACVTLAVIAATFGLVKAHSSDVDSSKPQYAGDTLVRPDGYVAWAVDGEVEADDLLELRDTLTRWFGEPRNRTARRLPAIRRALNDLHGEGAG